MSIYYVAGIPYSSELYHHGIKGQKWGVRRFQNPDGTLTSLGKIRYGSATAAKAVGKTVGKVASATGRAVGTIAKNKLNKFKLKHPWLVSDSELADIKKRVDMEKQIAQTKADTRRLNSSKAGELISDIAGSAAKKIMDKAIDKALEKKFEKKDKGEIADIDDILENPEKYTQKQLENALKMNKFQLDRVERAEKMASENKRWDITNLPNTKEMNKRELDQLNSWLSSQRRTEESVRQTEEYRAGRNSLDDWLATHSQYNPYTYKYNNEWTDKKDKNKDKNKEKE